MSVFQYSIIAFKRNIIADFAIHPLKFLAARILRHTPWQDAGLESMYTVLLQRDSRNEVCLQRINAYLRQEFDYELDHQEQVYLLIHLTKIVG